MEDREAKREDTIKKSIRYIRYIRLIILIIIIIIVILMEAILKDLIFKSLILYSRTLTVFI